jgi:hypothetical protein
MSKFTIKFDAAYVRKYAEDAHIKLTKSEVEGILDDFDEDEIKDLVSQCLDSLIEEVKGDRCGNCNDWDCDCEKCDCCDYFVDECDCPLCDTCEEQPASCTC